MRYVSTMRVVSAVLAGAALAVSARPLGAVPEQGGQDSGGRDEAGLVASMPLGFRNGWFALRARSSGTPLRLVFDTGANAHGVTQALARRLDLPRVGWTRLHGGTDSEPAWLVRGPGIRLGDARLLPGHRIIVRDEFVTDAAGTRYDGVIGTDLLERYDLRIDAPGGELRLYKPGLTSPREGAGAADALGPPMAMDDLGRGLVSFKVRVNGREMDAILDTGAPYTVLNQAAALAAGAELVGPTLTLASRGIGSGTLGAVPLRIKSLDIGDTRFNGVLAVASELGMFEALGLSDRPALLLGAPVVAACEMLISRAREEISVCRTPTALPQSLPQPLRLAAASGADDSSRER